MIERFALELLADGRLNVEGLNSHRLKAVEVQDAYQLAASNTPTLGILLDWNES